MSDGVVFDSPTADKILALLNQPGRQPSKMASPAAAFRPERIEQQIYFRNDSGETVPAYGCLAVTGAELDPMVDRFVVSIDKPSDSSSVFLFNSSGPVEAGKWGTACYGVVRALYDGTPQFGNQWGPKDDWAIVSGGNPALTVYGIVDAGKNTLMGNQYEVANCITVQFRSGGLPAANGLRPGSAIADVVVLTGNPPEYKRTGQTETIYNWSAEVLGDNGLRLGKAKMEDGFWQVSATDCEDERPFVAAELM